MAITYKKLHTIILFLRGLNSQHGKFLFIKLKYEYTSKIDGSREFYILMPSKLIAHDFLVVHRVDFLIMHECI